MAKANIKTNTIVHEGDLPEDVQLTGALAVDTETLGLNPLRDPLCLVQLADEAGAVHLVRPQRDSYHAPRLKAVLADEARVKIFHFARFDLAMLQQYLGVIAMPVYCTKIASKIARTYTDRHGLKDLCRELVGVDLSKRQQSSDWGADTLSPHQIKYAADDVIYLHACREKLNEMLQRENRMQLAQACFDFLPTRIGLDLAGWAYEDIFEH